MQTPTQRDLLVAPGHPIFLASLVLLLLNDHCFKQAWPGTLWTGKLSDVAWLVVAPVLLGGLLGLLRIPRARTLSLMTTGLVFTALQLWPPLGEAWVSMLGGAHVADAGDLLTLPALALAHRCWTRPRPIVRRWGRRAAVGVGVLGLMATSKAIPMDGRAPCADTEEWDPDRPLAIHWAAPSDPIPEDEAILEAGLSITGPSGADVPFSVRLNGTTLLVCPDEPLEPDTTYIWTVGSWPDLGAHHRSVPGFGRRGRWTFTTAPVGSWSDGCRGGREMAFVPSDTCPEDSGLY